MPSSGRLFGLSPEELVLGAARRHEGTLYTFHTVRITLRLSGIQNPFVETMEFCWLNMSKGFAAGTLTLQTNPNTPSKEVLGALGYTTC